MGDRIDKVHDRQWYRSPALLLFLGAFLLYAAGSRGYISTVDQQVRYFVAIQLWNAGSIHPTPEQLASTQETFAPGKDGHPISHFGIGQSVAMLPSVVVADVASALLVEESYRSEFRYLAAQFFYMALQVPAAAALGLIALYLLALRLGCAGRLAFASALALGFGTFWLFYTKTFAMDVEHTSALLWGVLFLARRPQTMRATAFGSWLCGIPLLYRQEMLVPVAVGLGIYAWSAQRRGELSVRRAASLLLPVVGGGLFVLWHNFERTGSIASAGYSEVLALKGLGVFADCPGEHWWGILFGSYKGFLWYNPIFIAATLLLLPGARRWSAALGWGLVPVIAFVLVIASMRNAETVCGWGPRFLVPITPFLILGVACAMAPRFAMRRYRVGFSIVLAANIAFQVVMGFEDHNGLLVQARHVRRAREEFGMAPLAGFRANDISYRLRNLGVPLGDPESMRALWETPEMQRAIPPFEQNLWWLKLRGKTNSIALRFALFAGGCCAAVAGALCMTFGVVAARDRARMFDGEVTYEESARNSLAPITIQA